MHTTAHHLYLQLLGCQLGLVVMERVMYHGPLVVIYLLRDLLLVGVDAAGTVHLILEGVIILELLGRVVPGQDDEDDAEEGPHEADTESPDHTFHLILELVHDRR